MNIHNISDRVTFQLYYTEHTKELLQIATTYEGLSFLFCWFLRQWYEDGDSLSKRMATAFLRAIDRLPEETRQEVWEHACERIPKP